MQESAAQAAGLRKRWSAEDDALLLKLYRSFDASSQRRAAGSLKVIASSFPGRSIDSVRNRLHQLRARCTTVPVTESSPYDSGSSTAQDSSSGQDPTANMPSDGIFWTEWTAEEDRVILEEVSSNGFKWRRIATQLPRRSESSVRNRYTRLLSAAQKGRPLRGKGARMLCGTSPVALDEVSVRQLPITTPTHTVVVPGVTTSVMGGPVPSSTVSSDLTGVGGGAASTCSTARPHLAAFAASFVPSSISASVFPSSRCSNVLVSGAVPEFANAAAPLRTASESANTHDGPSAPPPSAATPMTVAPMTAAPIGSVSAETVQRVAPFPETVQRVAPFPKAHAPFGIDRPAPAEALATPNTAIGAVVSPTCVLSAHAEPIFNAPLTILSSTNATILSSTTVLGSNMPCHAASFHPPLTSPLLPQHPTPLAIPLSAPLGASFGPPFGPPLTTPPPTSLSAPLATPEPSAKMPSSRHRLPIMEPLPVSVASMASVEVERFGCDGKCLVGAAATTAHENGTSKEGASEGGMADRNVAHTASNGIGGSSVGGGVIAMDTSAGTALLEVFDSIDDESLVGMLCPGLLCDDEASPRLDDDISRDILLEQMDANAETLRAVEAAFSAPKHYLYLPVGPTASPPFSPPEPTLPTPTPTAKPKTTRSTSQAAPPPPSGTVTVHIPDGLQIRFVCHVPPSVNLFACVLLCVRGDRTLHSCTAYTHAVASCAVQSVLLVGPLPRQSLPRQSLSRQSLPRRVPSPPVPRPASPFPAAPPRPAPSPHHPSSHSPTGRTWT